MAQVRPFKTEVSQLLNLMIHSLYSNKDIFLRELIANAADAIDRARFESLTNPELTRSWSIRIEPDKEHQTLRISDNGIGMTEEEVAENIGTIAKSGTKAFLQTLEEKGAPAADLPELIGQFGVGFYSAFMVAEEVTLLTKKAGSDAPAVRWTSKGEGEYEIEVAEKSEPGTEITLKMRAGSEFYLESWKLKEIVRRYSDFIAYPIVMPETKVNEDKTETVEDKVLNSQKAIWLRKADEITEDEHKSFFAHLSNLGGSEYLKAIPISAEGASEFKALIYIPAAAPFSLMMPDIQKKGLQLYVRRVFITDECKELLPDYLRFVSGVVDSNDLPLNVSREILQDNPQMAKIQKAVTGKILAELKKMQETEPENYAKFFREFGRILKEGIHTDYLNAEKIKGLAMYESMNGEEGKLISLDDYLKAMPPEQTDIYYISGDKRAAVATSPALEFYRSKGYDVLFMTDPIDEWVMQSMIQYGKKSFKSVAKGDFEVAGADKEALDKKIAAAAETYAKLVEKLKTALAGDVEQVRFSGRLTESPCCLVTEGHSIAPHMERLFRAMHQDVPKTKRILELNPDHELIAALDAKSADDAEFGEIAHVLYDQALLAEGSPIADPARFARQITKLLLKSTK
jgi:molecular chaperone HtpG